MAAPLPLEDVADLPLAVVPYDDERVKVVRAPPQRAKELYAGFTVHICTAFMQEQLLQGGGGVHPQPPVSRPVWGRDAARPDLEPHPPHRAPPRT